MAARRFILLLRTVKSNCGVHFIKSQNAPTKRSLFALVTAATGGGIYYLYKTWIKDQHVIPVVYARSRNSVSDSEREAEDAGGKKSVNSYSSYRLARFQNFASVEYEGVVYMTPQDFLESITEETPRPRIGRTQLSRSDLESWLRSTPKLSRGSDKLFRSLHNRGIISYTEYLFLLCVLTMQTDAPKRDGESKDEPHSGFQIAFNMFDTDGNQIVDKKEFLVLERVFSRQGQSKGTQLPTPTEENAFKELSRYHKYTELNKEIPDTTLLVHFFGPKGDQVLNYNDFHKFMVNLQYEVIELEFLEFSHGLNTITEENFARILLRYTNLDRDEIEECVQRVRTRIPEVKGISLKEFQDFCQFLNSLDDFALTIKMYTYAQQSVSQEDFNRAVKVCTGHTLGPHVVNTVFQIFDADGDGHLSHQEFINIMKDRLHRGARSHLMHMQNSLDAFKTCLRNEMRSL